MRTKILAATIILIAMYLLVSGTALAGYPHGSFSENPDGCAVCHRMHTATATNLVKDPNGTAMCNTCHWAGSGADTDVKNGVYLAGGESEHAWGEANGVLLAGGFENVGGSMPKTSQHKLDQVITPPGSDSGGTVTLKCISCHSPHPDKTHPNQYRLLRLRPGEATSDMTVGWNGPWTDETQASSGGDYRAYTERDWDSERPGVQLYSNNYGDGMSQWCTSCHTRYLTREDTDTYDAGDSFGDVKRFRHHADTEIMDVVNSQNGITYELTTDLPLSDMTGDGRSDDDKLMCLTCHRSHGTATTMTAQASLESAGRGSLPTGSMLLRRDSRGVCVNCHANI